MNIDNIIDSFLSNSLQKSFERHKIPSDASMRTYERIISFDKKYILMNSSREKEAIFPFIKITNILQELGLNAPEIINKKTDNGLLLLEDFGNNKLNHIVNIDKANEQSYYKQSIDCLVHLYNQSLTKNIMSNHNISEYSNELLLNEALLFIDWYLPLKEDKSEAEINEIRDLFSKIILSSCKSLYFDNNILVLRDYHADNIIFTDKDGIQKIGIIDFQDALIGNPAYDLMSLLEDARREVPEEVQGMSINYYLEQTRLSDKKDEFLNDYYVLAAIRNLKILGIFCRLKTRDGKGGYIKYLPLVKKYLKKDLNHPRLKELKLFLNKLCKTL